MGVYESDIDLDGLFKNGVDPERLKDHIFISPNKVAFVKKNVREGIIPRILHEFLISRIMIKKSSKLVK
jgi:DNA polymerase zeta